VQTTLVWTF